MTPEKTSETKGENKILMAKKKVGPTSFKWLMMLEILLALHQQAAEKASEKMRHRMKTQTIKKTQKVRRTFLQWFLIPGNACMHACPPSK